ncbi:hypothetical protein CYY_001447 [Polysphondylium violaceum]|uniref:Leucine-rich repeat-containing protein n=1 Tax=Polysphondylium violaceum TaxID=133409 RepID=A0A8J4PZU8_9MYCE|nr:hypothetical protein CYY_001447 [Polysphondylium violaceum]
MNKIQYFLILFIVASLLFAGLCDGVKSRNNKRIRHHKNSINNDDPFYRESIKRKEILESFQRSFSQRKPLSIDELTASTGLDSQEKIILESLYQQWDGKDWSNNTNWLQGDPCLNQWHGVTCREFDGVLHVTDLHLPDNGLVGPFPEIFAGLGYMVTFDLQVNHLYGSIPSNVFKDMVNLTDLVIATNDFTGDLQWLRNLPDNIITLWVAMNDFKDTVPDFLSKYKKLDLLFLEENELTGSIPEDICKITSLRLLDFGFNQLTGSLPSNMGELTKLDSFWLYDNTVSGTLPASMKDMQSLKLLDITRNDITGQVPDDLFTQIPNITFIRFTGNEFYGPLQWICPLQNVRELHLDANLFDEFPDCKAIWPLTIENFVASKNHLSGSIPESFGNMVSLNYIKISYNQITGKVPLSFSNLVNLNRLDISENQFNCTLSEIIDPIKYHKHLTILTASGNNITGEFMENMLWDDELEIELLTKMFIINLARNQLSGIIPPFLSWMPTLSDLDLSNNAFVGVIPNELNYLSTLYLENNLIHSPDGALPAFMTNGSDKINLENQAFSCPTIIGKFSNIRISLDSSYYNHSLCSCNIGHRGFNGSCVLCPDNSQCPGGSNAILIPQGYYPLPSAEEPQYLLKCGVSNFGFTPCNPDNEWTYSCKEGYEDRLCSKCSSGYFHRGMECSKCPSGPQSIVIFIIVVIVFILLFMFFVMTDPKRSLPSSTRKTIMYYYQVFNLLLSKLSPWPSFFSAFYSSSSWLNFSFGFLCIGSLSHWPNLFIVMLVLPIAFMVISLVFLGLMQMIQYIRTKGTCGFNKKWMYSGIRVNLLTLNFLYLPLCIYIFQNYTCQKDPFTGTSFMSFFPWVECGNNATYNRIFTLTVLFTIIYVIGIPLLFATLLLYNRKRLDNPTVLLIVGTIYIDYRKSVYWYELINLGKRFLMAVSLALIDPKSSFSVFVVLIVIGSSIIAQIKFKPYVYKISNYAETIGNSVLLFSYVCVLILASLRTTNLYDSRGIEVILSVVVVLYTAFLGLLFLFSLKYFLPKKWQIVIDIKIIKLLDDLKGFSQKYNTQTLSKELSEEEDNYELTKEPIFEMERPSNMMTHSQSIELRRRVSDANILSQSAIHNTNYANDSVRNIKPYTSTPNLSKELSSNNNTNTQPTTMEPVSVTLTKSNTDENINDLNNNNNKIMTNTDDDNYEREQQENKEKIV